MKQPWQRGALVDNTNNKSQASKVNSNVANNQATKDPVMPTTFLSNQSIKTFNPKDINTNVDEAEEAIEFQEEESNHWMSKQSQFRNRRRKQAKKHNNRRAG